MGWDWERWLKKGRESMGSGEGRIFQALRTSAEGRMKESQRAEKEKGKARRVSRTYPERQR